MASPTATPHVAARYQDWVQLMCDLVRAEDDGRPLIVLGASIGGLLSYEVAARTGAVARLMVTCLLDTQEREARRAASRITSLGGPAPHILAVASKFGDTFGCRSAGSLT